MKLKVQIRNSRIFKPLLNKWNSENRHIIRRTIIDFYHAYINKWKEIFSILNKYAVNNARKFRIIKAYQKPRTMK